MIMPKNIILCADGTGNEGGHTPDSNVFKIFNAIDLNSDSPEQITFYDNGVGTQRNKYIKGLSGALGFGFGGVQLGSGGTDSQWYMRTYHMTLLSEGLEEVPALICGGAYDYAFYVRYPDLQEINAALGEHAVLKLRQ